MSYKRNRYNHNLAIPHVRLLQFVIPECFYRESTPKWYGFLLKTCRNDRLKGFFHETATAWFYGTCLGTGLVPSCFGTSLAMTVTVVSLLHRSHYVTSDSEAIFLLLTELRYWSYIIIVGTRCFVSESIIAFLLVEILMPITRYNHYRTLLLQFGIKLKILFLLFIKATDILWLFYLYKFSLKVNVYKIYLFFLVPD